MIVKALLECGRLEILISKQLDQMPSYLHDHYLTKLEECKWLYKEYQELRKKLEYRRLDYSSSLNRLQRAGDEKPEIEQLLQLARVRYEETLDQMLDKVAELENWKVRT